ncbi:Uncharacterized conserved protein YlxW, UPF0749 family [Alkalithermobacter thermoalcaliphilus JW-YL-7 = DSM 7308]|uniref:Uncharacterized conserved protein YlxW, UPF0749 family n=1 Tax=Alkalithermobacter thermoalcaliphilus JW-YL-7 = DSM 7308 TaxID=1121328 RepID=A0A150FPL7_CLOPD|nr:protein of unknown function DUF881 [[Clostridium] paradoxum JW-YL-7 = DSM 7308]SHK98297.1 Uncharacterized conserved protein YlxW, UPF0749 family [[Clostridium] paradoxum JW-YL-7 = DSM 7308]
MNKIVKQRYVVLMSFLLGIIISIQLKSLDPNNVFVSLRSINEIKSQIELERIELENINRLISERKYDIAKYEIELKENGSIKSVIESELVELKAITGFKAVKGPGIVVSLADSERELNLGEDPNDIIVHDVDVLRIVNDLKVAGAEALAINGERIISLSEIKCSGPTITINGSTYGQPFVITAIGEPKMLEAAIKAPNSYASVLKDVYGLKVHSNIFDEIKIPKYNRSVRFKFIKEGD